MSHLEPAAPRCACSPLEILAFGGRALKLALAGPLSTLHSLAARSASLMKLALRRSNALLCGWRSVDPPLTCSPVRLQPGALAALPFLSQLRSAQREK